MSDDSSRNKIARRMRSALDELAKFARAMAAEAGRLNNARMEPAELKSLTRRERRRAVKAQLTEHHRNPNRCC
jgi:hypothetical protein